MPRSMEGTFQRLEDPGANRDFKAAMTDLDAYYALPRPVQRQIIEKRLKFYVIDATQVARDLGLGPRINTILQTCFFAISGVMPKDKAIEKIKTAIHKTYSQ